ncbi:MAG: 4-hydroxy-tetrahydrodipicolinate synthase, partial [Phycisphaerae bacterium]|nr:4-hydroxy-tetrahydrodipicolinate synthase [Phycisphaerae bacterium]MDW8263550.1 4-hydroxy-tetrahydrodipicolinate synthase [Phycisphaerales bacterium]
RGCATALVTPFRSDGAIDEPTLRRLVDHQIDNGVKLLVPCGTTGETATTTEAEDLRIIRIVIEQARGRARIIAGTGSNSTSSAVQYTRSAVEVGADAVLVVAPYYNKPTQSGLLAHFRAVAASAGEVPVILYNVPGRTGCNLLPATTLELARTVPNIVGIKEACGDLMQIQAILRDRPAGFRVFSGDDALTFAILALGGDGVVSVASNEAPRQMSELCRLCFAGEWEPARRLHYQLLPLMEANFIETSPGPVKSALAMMGLCPEHLRLPLVPPAPATKDRLRKVLTELGLLA